MFATKLGFEDVISQLLKKDAHTYVNNHEGYKALDFLDSNKYPIVKTTLEIRELHDLSSVVKPTTKKKRIR